MKKTLEVDETGEGGYDGIIILEHTMPTKIRIHPRAVKPLSKMLQEKQDEAWESIRGLWKNRKVNPVTYQRKLRDAADRRLS